MEGLKAREGKEGIRQALRDDLVIKPMVPTVTIELRDMDETTTEAEIREAFIAALVEATPDQVEVKALRAGPRKRDQSGTRSGTKSHSDCKGAKARQSW